MKTFRQPTLLEAKVMAFAGLTLESGHFFITERWGGKAQIPTTMLVEMALLLILAHMVQKGARPLAYGLETMSIYLMVTSALYLIGVELHLFHSISFLLSLTGLVEYGREYSKWAIEEKRRKKYLKVLSLDK